MVSVLVRTIGLGVEIAQQLVHEILSRNLRGRKAVACYAGVNRAKDLPVGVYMRDILGSASASAVDLGASAARIMCCRRGGFASEHLRARKRAECNWRPGNRAPAQRERTPRSCSLNADRCLS